MAKVEGQDDRGGETAFADVLGELQRNLYSPSSSSSSAEDKSKWLQRLAGLITSGSTQEDGSPHPIVPLGDLLSQETISRELERKYLRPNDLLDQSLLDSLQIHWDRPLDLDDVLKLQPCPFPTKQVLQRKGLDGHVVGLREVPSRPVRSTTQLRDASAAASKGASSSSARGGKGKGAITSLTRNTASSTASSAASFVRGRLGQRMFVPGGLEDEVLERGENGEGADDLDDEEAKQDYINRHVKELEDEIERGVGLITVPPGLKRGFRRGGITEEGTNQEDEGETNTVIESVGPTIDITDASKDLKSFSKQDRRRDDAEVTSNHTDPKVDGHYAARRDLDADLDELLPSQAPHSGRETGSSSLSQQKKERDAKRDWAHIVDINQKFTNFKDLVPDPAHEYPFELDNFQKEAVYHLEQGDSVFVAAHTSAGKTVVAEYAIALAQKHMTRCIYTSPIKALSNQKFRDFKQTFGAENVGILTGDVQINPEAPCLIMTTEILRSMLYRGADLIRDVEFVIFDEIHYVNDQERGVVWEEVIILCPQHISLILLSATVPNTKEFADWVGRTKKRDIYVISTPKRPVPLEHFLYAGKELHKIVDASGRFLNAGIKEAAEAIKRRQEKEREANGLPPLAGGGRGGRGGQAAANGRGGNRGQRGSQVAGRGMSRGGGGNFSGGGQSGRGDKSLWIHLVGMLKKRELLPVVTFVFSKKRCEEYASGMPNTDLCTAREKSEVHIVIEKSLTRLKGTDKELPQIARMRDLLSRGIGVHHGGLLPIVKEVVEMLFQRGLVKVLFATETFAMGVNMPARSVVFSGIRKHDGHSFRELLPGEYTQMSGRAGRRGLDATGVVIINAADELPESGVLSKMLLGQPTKLQSQFRLTYNMILNLLRVEALKVEEMIKRSFSENASQRLLPDQEKKIKEAEKILSSLPVMPDRDRGETLGLYYDLSQSAVRSNEDVMLMALKQQLGSKLYAAGRVVILYNKHFASFSPAVLVKQVAEEEFLVLAAVTEEVKSGKADSRWDPIPPVWPPSLLDYPQDTLVYDLREVPLSSIVTLTPHMLKIEQSMIMALRISAMQRTVNQMLPVIQDLSSQKIVAEVDWSKIRRLDFQEAVRARDQFSGRVTDFLRINDAMRQESSFQREYGMTHHRKLLEAEIGKLKLSISDENLELLPDYHQRVEVLKKMRFIDPVSENVLLKGRVACEINSVDELVSTELILDNFWNQFEPEEIVGLLSCLVFKEKAEGQIELQGRLLEGYETILATAERVSAVQAQFQLNTQDYETAFKTHMVPVAYHWAKGMPFADICQLTDIAEGTIVRVITRLDESCRELRDAARVIGDADLWSKMELCMQLIRRDVIFAASLYF